MSIVLNSLRTKLKPLTAATAARARGLALRQLSSLIRPTGLMSWRPVLSSARSLLRAKPASPLRRFATDSTAAPADGATAAGATPAADASATAGASASADAEKTKQLMAEKDKQLKELKEKVDAHEKTIKQTKDELLRAYAEMQNVRRIAKSDVQNANLFALQGIGKRLVDVLDNLQRATSSAANAGLMDTNGNPQPITDPAAAEQLLRSLLEGVTLTEKAFLKTLTDSGFKRFGADTLIGAKLDPNAHNVLFAVEDATKPANTIAQVLKDGYMLHERVLRPADVGVVKASKPAPAAPAAAASS